MLAGKLISLWLVGAPLESPKSVPALAPELSNTLFVKNTKLLLVVFPPLINVILCPEFKFCVALVLNLTK